MKDLYTKVELCNLSKELLKCRTVVKVEIRKRVTTYSFQTN